jgi:hypothetical protein
MFNIDTMKATGKVNVVLKDEHGNVKKDFTVNNLVVDDGLDFIAGRMKNTGGGHTIPTEMSHMAIGTDNTATTSGDNALGVEVGRTALTSSTVTDNSIAYVATFPAGTGTAALTEAGILNASTNGTLLCRTVFNVINKGAADTMTITWTITIS